MTSNILKVSLDPTIKLTASLHCPQPPPRDSKSSTFSPHTKTQYSVSSIVCFDSYPVISNINTQPSNLTPIAEADQKCLNVTVKDPGHEGNRSRKSTSQSDDNPSPNSSCSHISNNGSCVTPTSSAGKRRRRSLFFNSSESSFKTVDLTNYLTNSPHRPSSLTLQKDDEEESCHDYCCMCCGLLRNVRIS